MADDSSKKPVTALNTLDLLAMKQRGEKISCLTAYDASFSAMIEQAGIDVILVGDSLGMVIQGHDSTLPVSLSDMVYHTRCVANARQRALIIADLPFMTYPTPLEAAQSAARLIREGGAQVVKLEGARLDCVEFLTSRGISVCGHLGLLPQSINQLGRYSVQGKSIPEAENILHDALALERAGISLLVLECVPADLGRNISRQLKVPVIGIGAGIDCDGQVLVIYDMLNIGTRKYAKFSKDFLTDAGSIAGALADFHLAVKEKRFPTLEQSYS
ncbi:MAG: 3-methyl-2-oxobutanoate hydroxymethyltransferase [Methylobacter sp.]|nr:MAG: 3-methyl-2-oxobutanoate hydroxymethyltransferase [Methylobacter sp.]